MPAFQLFVLTLLLPLITIVMLWRRPRQPLAGWLATLFLALGITGFSVLTAPWGALTLGDRTSGRSSSEGSSWL